jgi:hypothetical protein
MDRSTLKHAMSGDTKLRGHTRSRFLGLHTRSLQSQSEEKSCGSFCRPWRQTEPVLYVRRGQKDGKRGYKLSTETGQVQYPKRKTGSHLRSRSRRSWLISCRMFCLSCASSNGRIGHTNRLCLLSQGIDDVMTLLGNLYGNSTHPEVQITRRKIYRACNVGTSSGFAPGHTDGSRWAHPL